MKKTNPQRVIDAAAIVLLAIALVSGLPALLPIHARDLAQTQGALEFRDRNGLLLGTILSRDQTHTVSVPLNRVAPTFTSAILAAEDARFFHHGAVDALAVGRAALQLIENRRVVSGASTVSMQLARMLRGPRPSLLGKVSDVFVASRLEAGMSKPEILTAYVNRLPMGGNVYGVEAAARTYFGVPSSDVDLAQATLLAAIPNDPARINPYADRAALERRRAMILDRMVANGTIDRAAAQLALAERLAILPRGAGIVAAPQFLFAAAAQSPPAGGIVHTTIDRPLQQFVEAQLRAVLAPLHANSVRHGAALVLDNASGDILAYVGSPDYFSDDPQGRNDGVMALRQPGSALKPFLYELALERNDITPTSMLNDSPATYAIPGGRAYTPQDYDERFLGAVRVRTALANSLNVPAVRTLEHVGVANFLGRLRALGFAHLDQAPDHYGLGLTLGGGEVSLLELARAYLTMSRAGDVPTLRALMGADRVQTSDVGERTAWLLVTDMIADRNARAKAFGTGSVLDMPFPAAVKTGTSSDFRDTWTVGFSHDYTVAVWVGNFDGKPMRGIAGIAGAAPLWNRIMLHLHEHADPAPIDAPPGYARKSICASTGKAPTRSCATVVQEFISLHDLAQVQPASPSADRLSAVRIRFPRDGDRFVFHPVGAHEPTQALEFAAYSESGNTVAWVINGKSLRDNRWLLTPGSWDLEAHSTHGTDHVRFTVEPARLSRPLPGFRVLME